MTGHLTPNPKVLIIGLDAVPFDLIFGGLVGELPNIIELAKKGIYGKLTSCHPPITVPAWTVMMTSKDPGTLGIYGFKHRRKYSYGNPWIVDSTTVKHDRVWDILNRQNKTSIVIGVPPAYPPYEINGKLVSCFLTPTGSARYCFPDELKFEIEKVTNGYKFDVLFRTEDRELILKEIYEMTEKRFALVSKWLANEIWDFFMFMEIGTDRIHHAFWKFFDKKHPKYVPNNPYEKVIPEYYRFLDSKVGELINLVGEDTSIVMASDHGTMSMHGAFCINEWLIKEGYLVLKKYPTEITDIDKADIDWQRTTAWGWGGYYARIFLNVEGRESNGRVNSNSYESVRDELIDRIQSVVDPEGNQMKTKAFKPEEIYNQTFGDMPDLMVYFDNLNWRSAGTIGHDTLYLSENDTGPDDSVHSLDGFFSIYDPRRILESKCVNASIYDVAPTLLDLMCLPVPGDMLGQSILS